MVAALVVVISVGGCGQTFVENMVIGTFDGGKLVALNWWRGTNSYQGSISLNAYADVPDQTTGTLDIDGPQHWRCTGVFTTPSDAVASGDQTKDKVVKLSTMYGGFEGPTGTYRVTIEVPSKSVSFSHTWKWFDWFAPESPSGALALYRNKQAPGHPVCTQVVDSFLLQRSLANQYLSRLDDMLKYPNWDVSASKSPLHNQFQALVDQARQAKISGDGQADAAARTAYYKSAAATLTKMAQLARDTIPAPNPPWDLAPATRNNIIDLSGEAAALLSLTGLN
jgi:hypothetical protein